MQTINNYMSFAIYDLDEDIRKLLNADNFLNGLSTNEFVEVLSKDHLLKGAEVNNLEYLDPKPYIRTFESTLRHLRTLAADATAEKSRAETEVADLELSHSRAVLRLSTQVEQIVSKFDHLDTEITGISRQIDPLNQALNKITNSRDRSAETIFLIRTYHGFYTKEKYDPLEKLRTARDKASKIRCARTVNNVLTLAKKIEALTGAVPKVAKCVTTIEKYSEMMEQALIERFELASDNVDMDFDEMRDIAEVLFSFNGGSSVVLAFMNRSELFHEEDHDESQYSVLEDEALWVKLADPNYRAVDIFKGESTELLLDRLKYSIKAQTRVVQQVFELPVPVIKTMVQRVYAQMVQNRVSVLLSYSQQAGPLAHVRVLHLLYVLVGDFTKDLREFIAANSFDDSDASVGATLDQSYSDLFIEYLLGHAYFLSEKDLLESTIYAIAQGYTTAHEKELTKKALEARMDDAMIVSGTTERNPVRMLERRRKRFTEFMKAHLLERSSTPNPESNEYDGITLANVHVVLKLAIEAVARILELEPARASEHALEILEILLLDFGQLYIVGGLEVAYDQAQTALSNVAQTEVNMNYLKVVNGTSQVLFLVSSCIKKILLPCAANDPAIKNRMVSLTNSYVARCETALNLVLGTAVDLVTERITILLLRQKRKDFLCDTISSSQDYTEVCEAISDEISHVHDSVLRHLNAENLENMLMKIGIILLNLLLEHFKKFPVNSTGGIVLTQDVIHYQLVIDTWGFPELSERFQILREISNLFTVQPNLLNSLVTEGHLATLKVSIVKSYIARRSDFTPTYMERFFGRK